jgi:hypothetical protein
MRNNKFAAHLLIWLAQPLILALLVAGCARFPGEVSNRPLPRDTEKQTLIFSDVELDRAWAPRRADWQRSHTTAPAIASDTRWSTIHCAAISCSW